jgi:hypothetical protein
MIDLLDRNALDHLESLFKEYLATRDHTDEFESFDTERGTANYGLSNFLDWLEERITGEKIDSSYLRIDAETLENNDKKRLRERQIKLSKWCSEVLEGGHTHLCEFHESPEHEAQNWKPAAHTWQALGTVLNNDHLVSQQCPQHRKLS